MRRPYDRSEPAGPQIRINRRIRASEVRVIDSDGSMLGVYSLGQAVQLAEQRDLDLVEVNPKASPPVCKLMDFGRFKYEEKKRAREQKRRQSVVEVKEMKLRPKTDEHDLNWKIRDIKRFLEEGNKVKLVVRFRGREMAHPERANLILDRVIKDLEGLAVVEMSSRMEGRTMTLLLAPKPGVKPAAKPEGGPRARKSESSSAA